MSHFLCNIRYVGILGYKYCANFFFTKPKRIFFWDPHPNFLKKFEIFWVFMGVMVKIFALWHDFCLLTNYLFASVGGCGLACIAFA